MRMGTQQQMNAQKIRNKLVSKIKAPTDVKLGHTKLMKRSYSASLSLLVCFFLSLFVCHFIGI